MTAVPDRDSPDVVDWAGVRAAPQAWAWIVTLLVVLGVGAWLGRGAGDADPPTQIRISAMLLGTTGPANDAPIAARIRVVNDGPRPVSVRFLELGAQPIAGADRVEPQDGRDITVPLTSYDCGTSQATIRIEVRTPDGRSRVMTLPLDNRDAIRRC